LTNRLKTLVEYKIVEKREYSSKPRRYEYHLTSRGEALIPILAELEKWGTKMVKK
jgi:DNA-binding HxlR family transcriptional regulator